MKKLYEVQIIRIGYIYAESREDAEEYVTALREDVNGQYDIVGFERVKNESEILPEWLDAPPIGDDVQDLTCREILKLNSQLVVDK